MTVGMPFMPSQGFDVGRELFLFPGRRVTAHIEEFRAEESDSGAHRSSETFPFPPRFAMFSPKADPPPVPGDCRKIPKRRHCRNRGAAAFP
jgi:hypothetical protein